MNIDNLPERNQEPTEKGEIKLLAVVALTNAPLEGYHYQLCHTVNAWLELADNDILYLEVAEDFDIESDGTFMATQVKHTQRNISLRSEQVIDAINNFWKLRNENSNRCVKFRLLTKSKIVKEKDNEFGMDKPGLELWSHCPDNEVIIKKISDFLQNDKKISDEVKIFLKKASPQEIYEQLIEPITWDTDAKDAISVEHEIKEKLIYHGKEDKIPASHVKKVFAHLFTEAFSVATRKDNRKLTQARFLEIFEEQTTVRVPIYQYIRSQQPINLKLILNHFKEELLNHFKEELEEFAGDLSEFTIQSHPHIQTDVPPLLLDIVVPRTDLLTEIQTKLQSEGIVVIQGGVDTGKTTLAKLTANAIDTDWFWLKFTNKEVSHTVQDLKQLANAVSNRSTPANVILDDLNLQPQQLREYEEDLGIVAYRVLERGAKLLITSQYKPPNNLIRSLGLSLSVVVHIPNFTIPEIEQFAIEMGCPPEDAKALAELFQLPTKRHPRLVHALFTQLRKKGWKQQDIIESIFQSSSTMAKEFEEARQLLTDLPKDQREFLYRLSLMVTEFRRECALNIGKIPEPIPHPGLIFSQLVGPWIDQVDETYYTISPLLTNAAKEDLSDESKIKNLHAHIANAILKTKKLTPIEAWAVFTHSMEGENKEGIIAFIYSFMNAPQDDWSNLCQEFSLLAHIKIDPPEELFPGDAFLNQLFRSLQYRMAVEVKPELAPKILEVWDQEAKPYETTSIISTVSSNAGDRGIETQSNATSGQENDRLLERND